VKKTRPVNLDLRTIKQPLPAIASILHRMTGIILFIGVAFMLYVFDLSLDSPQGFDAAADMLSNSFFAKLIAWGLVSALLYHSFAGIKHLIMDCGYCEELESGTMIAKVTLIAGVVSMLLAGIWIW
jgi:succinate dehydrogenase / fumarate reductase cytochrome b subunit